MRFYRILISIILIEQLLSLTASFSGKNIVNTNRGLNACTSMNGSATYIQYMITDQNFAKLGLSAKSFTGNYNFLASMPFYVTNNNTYANPTYFWIRGQVGKPNDKLYFDGSLSPAGWTIEVNFGSVLVVFGNGNFQTDLTMFFGSTAINFYGLTQGVSPSALKMSASYQNINPTSITTLSFNFTTPCVYLPASSVICINLKSVNSSLSSNYSINGWKKFSTSLCDIKINGVRPSGVVCTVSDGALYISNWITTKLVNSTLAIVVNGIQVVPSFLGIPSIEISQGSYSPGSVFLHSILAAPVNNITLAYSSQSYLPSTLNSTRFIIALTVKSSEKIPLVIGSFIILKFLNNFVPGSNITVKLTNLFNNVIETQLVLPLFNNWYRIRFTNEYLLDYGINIQISDINSPAAAGTSNLNVSLYGSNNRLVSTAYSYPMVFE